MSWLTCRNGDESRSELPSEGRRGTRRRGYDGGRTFSSTWREKQPLGLIRGRFFKAEWVFQQWGGGHSSVPEPEGPSDTITNAGFSIIAPAGPLLGAPPPQHPPLLCLLKAAIIRTLRYGNTHTHTCATDGCTPEGGSTSLTSPLGRSSFALTAPSRWWVKTSRKRVGLERNQFVTCRNAHLWAFNGFA